MNFTFWLKEPDNKAFLEKARELGLTPYDLAQQLAYDFLMNTRQFVPTYKIKVLEARYN